MAIRVISFSLVLMPWRLYVYSISARRFFSSKVKRWVAASLPKCLTAFRTTSAMSSVGTLAAVSWFRGVVIPRVVSWCRGITVSWCVVVSAFGLATAGAGPGFGAGEGDTFGGVT